MEYQLFLEDQQARGLFSQPDHWPSLQGAFSLAMGRNTRRAHERVRLIQYALNQVQRLKHVVDRAHTLALASSLNLDQISPLAQDRVLERVYGSDGVCRLDLGLHLKQVFAFTNLHAAEFARNGAREHNRIRTLVHELERVLSSTLDRSRLPEQGNTSHHADDRYWLIRGILLALTLYLYDWQGRSSLHLSQNPLNHTFDEAHRGDAENQTVGYAINTYLDLYVTFALLEQRIQGKIPATEGLLLVKERRKTP